MAKSVSTRPTKTSRPVPAAAGSAPAAPQHGRAFVALDQIDIGALRTRDLNQRHVLSLAESIGAIGMIHPPAVDRKNRLLAGAHRLAALSWLEANSRARFLELFPEGIPVWRMDLSADSDADLALAVEISENEQRRDYSSAEIQKLADRLKSAGFHYATEGGRPKADARPLMPALEAIVGKSVRQLRRILNPPARRKAGPPDLRLELKQFLESSGHMAVRLAAAQEVPELFTLKAQLERVNRLTERALTALAGSKN
jgi:ParB family chromosome partitioning protein